MSLARNTLVQSTLILGSRLLGFVRDLFLAARFGQGPLMDAFTTALMLPNLFRRLFAEGAFAQAFVPLYGETRERDGEAAAARMASETGAFLMAFVAAFCLLLQILMPWLMPLLLSAWRDDPETLRLAVIATQLAMPYLACMSLAALLSGVLNTAGRFALSAGVPVLLNLCTLIPLAGPMFGLDWRQETILLAASAAVTVSGVLQAGLLWWGVRRLGVRLRLHLPRLTPAVRKTLKIAVPGALAGGAMQLNSVVSQILSGSDEGARSVLYNADRLYQLPLGLIGVAIGLALVPRLTRAFVSGDEAGGHRTLDDGVALAMAFTLPAAAALFVIPFVLIDATTTRGAFTSADAARTAEVLRQFAWGVPAFVLAKVLTPPFFARQDTRRPIFGLKALDADGVIGLAIATSAAAWLNVGLLAATLWREAVWRPSPALLARLARVGLAVSAMGAVLFAASVSYAALSAQLTKEVAVVATVAAGGLVYALAIVLFRAATLSELKAALRREPGATLTSGPD